jgi:membrane protein implicated in regulation of membrane protease activity
MDGWVWWIVAAAGLGIAELLTMGLFLAPFAVGAVLAGALTAIGTAFVPTAAAFAVIALLLLVVARPLLPARRRLPAGLGTGTAALVGARALVVERIAFPDPGAVKIEGEVWTARAYGEDEVIEPGTVVAVVEIRGATALVTE